LKTTLELEPRTFISAAAAILAPELAAVGVAQPCGARLDRYEPVPGDDLSKAPQRLRPQPRPTKDDVQLGESSRVHETRPAPPHRVEYEKAPPTSRRLLDRLSLDPLMPINDQSLWDRVQILRGSSVTSRSCDILEKRKRQGSLNLCSERGEITAG
jgi:hypothetical protein